MSEGRGSSDFLFLFSKKELFIFYLYILSLKRSIKPKNIYSSSYIYL